MADTTYNIRASANGNQYSKFPAGNYVPGGTTVNDGQVVQVVFPGGGDNIAPGAQAFLGGVTGPVESAAVGAVFSSFMPNGWGMPGGAGSYVRNVRTFNGTKALCNSREGGAYQFGIRFDPGAPKRTMFARYSYFFDNPNNISLGQLKQFRVCGKLDFDGIDDKDIANILLTHYNTTALTVQNRGADGDPEGGGDNTAIYRGQADPGAWGTFHADNVWVTVEVAITINTAPGIADGRVKWTARREDTREIIGEWTASNKEIWTHGQPYRYFVLQMYMGNGYDETCKLYIDRDVYFSWSDSSLPPKFVILGDSPTFSPDMVKTVCQFTDWDDVDGNAQVSVKVNKGAHSDLNGKYLYLCSDVNTAYNSAGIPLQAVPVTGAASGSSPDGLLSWVAPDGLMNGKTITVTSPSLTFNQPSKHIHLGFGMGWLYEQADGTAMPSSLTINGQTITQQATSSTFVGRTVATVGGRKVLRSVIKPNGDSQPYGAGFLIWDNGANLQYPDTPYLFKSSRMSIGALPSGDYQWKQFRIWPASEVSGEVGDNCAYLPFGPGGYGSVSISPGLDDVRLNATLPEGVVGADGVWSSFGWAWRINTVDQSDGATATHYKASNTVGLIRRNPSRVLYNPTRTVYGDSVVRSESAERPRYMMLQDYIGNTGAGDRDFIVDTTDLYWKVGGDLFVLADNADLSLCVENPIPMVPIAFNGPGNWTFRLWLGEMSSFAGKYIHRLDSTLNPLHVVAL